MTLAVLSQPAGPNAGHRRLVPDGAWSAPEDRKPADGGTGLDRLLFMPLTPIIVPAPAWRPETPAIPLTALPALAAAVFAGLGAIADPVAAIIRDTAWRDGTAIVRAGALLWPHAARILDAATNMAGRPGEWATTGLPASLYPMLASGAAAILREAPAINLLTRPEAAGAPFPEDALSAILTATAGRGPAAWALVIQVLLARLPHPDALLRLAASARGSGGGPALRAATERGIAALLDRSARQGGAHGPVGHLKLCDAGMETRRLASLLEGLAGESAGPDRRRHAEILRARLDPSCQARFAAGLEEELVAPLRELHSHSSAPTPAPLARLEAAARALRRLETEARRVGSAMPYNRMLYQASALLKAMPDDGKLALVDRVRLVEILTGPEEALALLASRAR